MSALPKAVQRQVAEANRIAEELKKGNQPPAASPNQPAADPNAATANQPPAAPAAPAAQPPAAAPGQPEESWERKYRVLQGKYNAEVPRLQTQYRDLTDKYQQLQSQLVTTQALLTSLNRQPAPAPAQPAAAPPAQRQKLVKDEEVTSFGADLIDVMRRVVREELPATPSVPAQPNAQVVQQVQQVQQQVQQIGADLAQTKQQKMLALLDEQVPDWRTVNEDPEFLAWLDQSDAFSGVKRQQLFDQAAERNDGPRVVAFFKGFQTEHAVVTPPAPQPPAPQPAAQPAAAPVAQGTPAPLERFVAPGATRAPGSGAPNEAQKRIYTRAEIEDFTRRKNGFVIKGRKVPDALVTEEREILKAANEGRISG